jgi:diguanylate cyclase (GGDEF)-like protein/PAS domain S-box-containing protein
MIIDIIYNISLLLSISVIYATLPIRRLRNDRLFLFLMGVILGAVGILIMSRPLVLAPGVVFDGRSILLGVTAMFFGTIPACIAACAMVVYRIYIGGSGMVTGILVILTASGIGIGWHHLRFKKFMESKNPNHIELYLVGLVVHIVMLVCMVSMPPDIRRQVLISLSLPILLVYPLGSYFLSMLLYNQMLRLKMVIRLEESEQWFKAMFEQAPMGIVVTDSKSGTPVSVNRKFLEILGMTKEGYHDQSWREITHPDDLAEDEALMHRLMVDEIPAFTMDKRYIRPDGTSVWVNMAVTKLAAVTKGTPLHLCMITDITARKEMEQAILWANRHDVLTGLDNRQSFEEELAKADERMDYPLALLIGDLNGLKVVNDAFGRESGDNLLIKVARVIEDEGRDCIVCARFGGDEFALLCENTEELEAWEIANRISSKIEKIGVHHVTVTMSFGVAVKTHVSESLNELVKRAENGLNWSKLNESPSTRSRAINTIISTLHEKNRREELHSRRVSVLVVRIAEAAGLGTKKVAELRTAGLLHDIGKIAIDESILNKQGKLTPREWEAVRRHPETGWRILGSVGELGEMANYVLAHHERMDGKGYPRGLRGDDIPLEARIIAIADAYDAMTAARTYREPIGDRQAAIELKTCAGTQFDKDLTRLFVEQVLQFDWNSL